MLSHARGPCVAAGNAGHISFSSQLKVISSIEACEPNALGGACGGVH